MFLINCPYCGEREQSEFKAGGEAHNSKVVKDPQKFTQLWNTMIDWQFTMEPMKGLRNRNSDTPKQVMAERGKTTGGTSTINAMMWVRASKEDCDRWENAGAKGWEYSNVLNFQKHVQNKGLLKPLIIMQKWQLETKKLVQKVS